MTAPAQPIPAQFRLAIDPDVRIPRRGVVIGGSPMRVLRFGEQAARLLDEWEAGSEIGSSRPAGQFARRLVDAGIAHPRPPLAPELRLSIVIPVRDRAGGLRSTLDALASRPADSRTEVIVVDDGSVQPVTISEGALANASVIRIDPAGGPAAARNAGWRATSSEIVVFLDADCVPSDGWLQTLTRHFADPLVGAVAPRILSDTTSGTSLAKYESVRSSLDLGDREALVRPRTRVAYVPSACIAIRREALIELGGFDEKLRFGEDVDLVWRLHRIGRVVRYEPAASVVHPPRPSFGAWLRQRFEYGRSAAHLGELHGSDIAPLDVSPWSAAAWALAVAGQPAVSALMVAVTGAALARRAGPDQATARELARLAVRGNVLAGARLAEAVRRAWLPLALVGLGAIRPGKARRRSAALIGAAFSLPAGEWFTRKPPVGPSTWTVFRIADDLSYQAGLWCGVITRRSLKALLPRF